MQLLMLCLHTLLRDISVGGISHKESLSLTLALPQKSSSLKEKNDDELLIAKKATLAKKLQQNKIAKAKKDKEDQKEKEKKEKERQKALKKIEIKSISNTQGLSKSDAKKFLKSEKRLG